jgi:hypothetical protein
MGEKKMFTCQNPSCKKSFALPLKTLNLQKNPTEPYFACPYCLTQIKEIEETLETGKSPQEKHLEKIRLKLSQVETIEKTKNDDKSLDCHHYHGFLSERSSKEQIPDECLVCKDIVECMLRKMRA